MEYVKYYGIKYSNKLNKNVSILEYQDKTPSKIPYMYCNCCNKPIKRKMIVLQDPETNVEEYYLGFDCAKKFVNI